MRQIVLTPLQDSVGWMASVPSLPGCVTEGDTQEEAVAYAQEAMAVYLETLEAKGWDVPPEDGGGILENTTHDKASHGRKTNRVHQNTGTRGVRTRAATGKSRHARKQ